MSTTLVFVGLIGFIAQFVDGALGMGYGVTSATLLMSVGLAPAYASATVHLAELGTTLMSGTAHWRFGNVHWRAVTLLAVPGAIGGFVGAVVLSGIAADSARPWVAIILSLLGVLIIARAAFGRGSIVGAYAPRLRSLGPLGLIGGFLDAVGGGGWGPVTTSTLMAANRMAPRRVIGTVSAAEFLVALGASIGFLLALGSQAIAWEAVFVLLLGGLVAAPLAAWLVRRLDHRVLGVLVGGMILFYNADRALALVGADDGLVAAARVLIAAASILMATLLWRGQRAAGARSAALGETMA